MEDKCPIRTHFDNRDGQPFYICAICECPLGTHAYFFHCPLLDDELICADCCQQDVEKDTIIKTFEDLGKEHSREAIEKTCGDCGNRSCGKLLPED
jgi:hypothetical protein